MLNWKGRKGKTSKKEMSSPKRMRFGRTNGEVIALKALRTLMINSVEKEVKSMADVRHKELAEVGWNKRIFSRDQDWGVWIHLD